MPDTFSRIYTISSTNTVVMQAVTDGTDIFFEDKTNDPRSIYKYDVALNTHSKLVDTSAFGGTGTWFDLIVFRSNIYAAVLDSGAVGTANPVVLIYRVNPSTGAATLVNGAFPKSVHTSPGGSGVDDMEVYLYSTESILVASYRERRNFPGPPPEPAEHISQSSTNGTSWSTATNSYSETVELQNTAADARAAGKDFRTLGIYDSFPTTANQLVFLKFDAGVWTKVHGPVTIADPTDQVWEVAADYFWTRDDFGEYTSDWVTFPTPTGLSGRMVGLNMPWAVCQDFWGGDHIFYKINTASPPNETEDSRIVGTGLTTTGNPTNVMIRLNDGNTLGFFKSFDASFPNWSIWQRSANLPATPGAWGGVSGPPQIPSRKPADVDADGDNLYIAVLVRGGTPGLYKLDTSLSFDPTLVFDPMTGTNIGVQCGRLDADVIWIAGEFGSGNTVEKSEDAGATFDVKDGGTFGNIKAFVVGPSDDDRVLVFDTSGDEIYETKNSGDSWELINAATGTNLVVLERFSLNPEEIIAGSDDAYITDNISYSINSGEELHDLNLPVAQEVSSVVIR